MSRSGRSRDDVEELLELLSALPDDAPREFERPERQHTVTLPDAPWEGVPPEAFFAFKVGPVEAEDGDPEEVSFYAALSPSGGVLEPVMAPSDAQGLEALRTAARDRALLCDATLAEAGRTLGLEQRPAPRAILEARATSAFNLVRAGAPEAQPLGPPESAELLHACADLARAAPWRWWTDELPFRVHLRGDYSGERELCVMGAGRHEFGFVLYDRLGALAQVARLPPAPVGRSPDALGLSLEDAPAWATEAVEALTGVPLVPSLLRVRAGTPQLAGDADAVLAAGVAQAVASAARLPALQDVTTLVHAAGKRFSVELDVPFPVFSGRYVGPPLPTKLPAPTLTPSRRLPAASPSEVLVEFARHILDAAGPDAEEATLYRILALALAVWNAKVLDRWEEPGDASWFERVRATLGRLRGPEHRTMREDADALEHIQDEEYADDPRVFDQLAVELGRHGDFGVRVASAVTPGAWPTYLGVTSQR